MMQFRAKKKLGQIYINIPDQGSFSVETNPECDPLSLNPALKAARDAFWKAYEQIRSSKHSAKKRK